MPFWLMKDLTGTLCFWVEEKHVEEKLSAIPPSAAKQERFPKGVSLPFCPWTEDNHLRQLQALLSPGSPPEESI